MDLKTILRFVSKLKTSEHNCWEWIAARSQRGYGKITIGQQDLRSHRLAWMIFKGCIPDGMLVLHKCDNPRCCNPEHLFLGTSQDNQDDKVSKGRQARGDGHYSRTTPEKLCRGVRHGNAKLTDDLVRKIRAECTGMRGSISRLARELNVSKGIVWAVKSRKIWAHVPDVVSDPDKLVFGPGT